MSEYLSRFTVSDLCDALSSAAIHGERQLESGDFEEIEFLRRISGDKQMLKYLQENSIDESFAARILGIDGEHRAIRTAYNAIYQHELNATEPISGKTLRRIAAFRTEAYKRAEDKYVKAEIRDWTRIEDQTEREIRDYANELHEADKKLIESVTAPCRQIREMLIEQWHKVLEDALRNFDQLPLDTQE